MKKLKTLLFASTLLAGFSSVAMGQSTDNATINANANVVQAMVVGGETKDLEFKNILIGSGKFIDAVDGSADAATANSEIIGAAVNGITGGESRGYFSIEIAEGITVDLSLDEPDELKDDEDNGLFVHFSINGDELNGLLTTTKPEGTTSVTAIPNGESSNFAVFGGGPNQWNMRDPFTMPAGGKVYLSLGGTVVALNDQALGTYSGTITLTATVTN